jgi:hypothetical protein
MKARRYEECCEAAVPASVNFDVTPRNQGQTVEVAYGGFGRAEHDAGDPYKRITDRSTRSVTYYRLVGEAEVNGLANARLTSTQGRHR